MQGLGVLRKSLVGQIRFLESCRVLEVLNNPPEGKVLIHLGAQVAV